MSSSLDPVFIALADPARRHVVALLRRRPHSAGELAAAANMSAPAMSRHLRVLRRTKLIEEGTVEHDARVRLYRLRREPFARLQAWLEDIDRLWTDELTAFKAHAERAARGKKK
jgi:DNA-binding transcriptional ArsR family regulator